MLIKSKDSSEHILQELEALSKLPNLPTDTLARIEREIKTKRFGDRGEYDSAYYIDFYFKDSPNWAIVHDLRIEYQGNIAQIDHLLINRLLDFYVLESKNYAYGLKITELGEFLFLFNKHYVAIESPIEQNKRHVFVLERLLRGEELLPKRLGITLSPVFKPYVLVSPKSRVTRPANKQFDTKMVIKSDELRKQIQSQYEDPGPAKVFQGLSKLIGTDTLQNLAERLASYHRPTSIDYCARYGIIPISPQSSLSFSNELEPLSNQPLAPTSSESTHLDDKPVSKYFCAQCKKIISEKAAAFCFKNKQRFGGKAFCFNCQKHI